MTTLTAQIPDTIYHKIRAIAEKEHISMDQLVSMALNAQIAVMLTMTAVEERAKRGSWDKAKSILANAPAVEPEDYDKLDSP